MKTRKDNRTLVVYLVSTRKDRTYRRGILQLAVSLGIITDSEFHAWLVNPPTDPN